jgi:hydroxyacylglutathione hydrolase
MKPAAKQLYRSAVDFLSLPDYLQVWPGHGAGSACGKALGAVPESTVGYERRFSPAFAAVSAGEAEFVDFILAGQPEPPPYFARMKKLNRDGPPILGPVPVPKRVSVAEVAGLAGNEDAIVLDTRLSRPAFMAGHLTGSIHTPFNKSFPTIAGSYVKPEQAIHLIVEEERVEAVVLDLIRIGLDRIESYATPSDLEAYGNSGGQLEATPVIDFEELERMRSTGDPRVLDVRGAAEFESGHVPGAVNIAHTRLGPRLGEVPRGEPLHVHCQGGGRAGSASSFLERQGFDVVLIDDDFANWREREKAATASGAR